MKWLKKITGKQQDPTSNLATMKVSHFLTPQTVHLFHAGPSKQQVIGTLLGSLQLPDPNAALKAILGREEVGSTVIAPGLALPHARVPGITSIQAALGLSATGIVDPKSAEPIKIVVLFLGPADNMREHLAFLATVSTLFQKKNFDKQLLQCHTSEEVMKHIRKAERDLH